MVYEWSGWLSFMNSEAALVNILSYVSELSILKTNCPIILHFRGDTLNYLETIKCSALKLNTQLSTKYFASFF